MKSYLFRMEGFQTILLFWLIFSSSLFPCVSFKMKVSCPDKCICTAGLVHVRCVDLLLIEVPTGMLSSETRELDLERNSLTTIPDRVFTILHSLIFLDLSNNIISVLEPFAFAGLRLLRKLFLAGNRLVVVTAVSDLPALEQLSLNRNLLESLQGLETPPWKENFFLYSSSNPLRGLSGLTAKVRYLYADSCGIWVFDVHKCERADEILVLSLKYNRIKWIPSLGGMRSLLVLRLTGNLIHEISPSFPPSLQQIFLDDNEIREYDNTSPLSVLNAAQNQVSDVFDVVGEDTDILKKLYLADNLIQTANFPRLSALTSLDLSRCQLRGEFTWDPTKLPSLLNLLLRNNRITVFRISDQLVNGPSTMEQPSHTGNNLQSLVLDNNDISDLSSLRHFTSLSRLSVKNNKLRSITWNDDASHDKLQNIYLGGNRFSVLRGFHNMTELSLLNLQDNEIVTVLPDALSGTEKLRMLNLAGNKLKRFPTFSEVRSIEVLKLQCNNLESIEDHHLDQFPRLSSLNVSTNRLVNLKTARSDSIKRLLLGYNFLQLDGDFHMSRFSKLEVLNLEANQIERVNVSFWHGAETLFTLDLSLNRLTSGSSILLNARGIELNGNNNMIAFLPVGFLQEQGSVLLSGNRIRQMAPMLVAPECLVTRLDLSWNRIEMIPSNTFEQCVYLRMVNLEGNPLIDIPEETFRSIQEIYLANTLLGNVPWRTLTRDIEDIFVFDLSNLTSATNFSDLYMSSVTFIKLRLRNNGLRNVPNFGSALVLDLDLSHNMIQKFHVNTFRSLHTLRKLFFDHNDLQTIPHGAFKSCHLMLLLSLEFNSLKYIPEGAFDGIEHTHVRLCGNSLVSMLTPVLPIIYSYVSFGFNPWHCSCSNLAFHDWLDRNGNDELACYTPKDLLGKSILSAFAEELQECIFSDYSAHSGNGDFEDNFLVTSVSTFAVSEESAGYLSAARQDYYELMLSILLLGVYFLSQ